MIRSSRFVAAIGLVLALGVASLAFGDGASENEVTVLGKITPTKLPTDEVVPVTMYNGVTTSTTHSVPGQQNAEKVTVEYPKNMFFSFKNAAVCTAPLNGTTTAQAKAACPAKSIIGSGTAHANLGGGPDQVNDVVVTVIVTKKGKVGKVNGRAKPKSEAGEVSLHAASESLGPANTQVVHAEIEPKASESGFGPALVVNDAPDLGGDAFMLTLFDATIQKTVKGVLAWCKTTTNKWRNNTTYDDGSKDVGNLTTKCKQKQG